MKGMVFTELMDMVEDRFGPATLEHMVEDAKLPHGGAYTRIGSYPADELVSLVNALSHRVKTPSADLVKAFGIHLFERFTHRYPQFFDPAVDAFTFLERVDGYVHVEVRKLYPDAELPSFETQRPDDSSLVMIYRSHRQFGALAEGLLLGAIQYFGEDIALSHETLDEPGITAVRFTLRRTS